MLKHEGTLRFGKLVMPASGKTVEHTPQAFSVSYDQVKKNAEVLSCKGICELTSKPLKYYDYVNKNKF